MSWVNKEDLVIGETYQLSAGTSPFKLLSVDYQDYHYDGKLKMGFRVEYSLGSTYTTFNKTKLWKKKGTTMDKQLYTMLNRENAGEKATLVGKKLSGYLVMELTDSEEIVTVPPTCYEDEEVEGMVLDYIEQMCERGDGDAIQLRTILLKEWT